MAIGEFLTTKDVAEKLGVTTGRVHHFVVEGRLKVFRKIGSLLFFNAKDVEDFAKSPRKNGRPKKTG